MVICSCSHSEFGGLRELGDSRPAALVWGLVAVVRAVPPWRDPARLAVVSWPKPAPQPEPVALSFPSKRGRIKSHPRQDSNLHLSLRQSWLYPVELRGR